MTVTMEDTLDIVRSFVKQRGGDPAQIESTTRLLSDGHLDSFSLVELIADLQAGLPVPIDDGALIPEDFESVETLHARLAEVIS